MRAKAGRECLVALGVDQPIAELAIAQAPPVDVSSVIGKRVMLGEGCVLHPNVTIYDNVDIGRGSILHSGAVIGADGFGYVMEHDRWHKFPQVGRVEIGSFVEIGANSCVDRAALGVTSIGEGTKLDNLVHVGHNCRIGRHVVVAAQTGFLSDGWRVSLGVRHGPSARRRRLAGSPRLRQ